MSTLIPQPAPWPLLGNVLELDSSNTNASLQHLAAKYGPIFKLSLLDREAVFVNSVELLNEICDEKRFHKSIRGGLKQVRNGVGDGLFTAYDGEHNWGVAHRTLVPAFGPLQIHDMFDEMHDIASQLVARWARTAGEKINVTDDYTRLTLDSIALCAMDKRFNSFYSETMHPFVTAMVDFLLESGRRASKTSIQLLLGRAANQKYQHDIDLMKEVAQEVVNHRRANPSSKKDLLNALVLGKDPKTGEHLTDENIMNNMITLLIAGHETTAGLLSFATYQLMKHPEVVKKAQAEVDEVVGKGAFHVEHVSKLPYIEAILRETLRLSPTAPGFTVEPNDSSAPVILAGKYVLPQGAAITANLVACGRDQEVYGEDASEFKPERMYKENFTKLPPNAWKPFGNGQRGCIGRPFAWQEAVLSLAMIMQNFNLRLDDPSYQLAIKQTLTIKPANLFMRVSLREGVDAIDIESKLHDGASHKPAETRSTTATKMTANTKPMTVIYGSNSGTCEGLAQSLVKNAPTHGYKASLSTMDEAVEKLTTDQPVVIVTASYEGQPTDNAKAFVEWLTTSPRAAKDVQYAVFGCGHSDWASTFHKIPQFVDRTLEEGGGKRITKIGATNVAEGTIFDDFDAWQDKQFWPALTGNETTSAVTESLEVEVGTSSRASDLNYGIKDAVILSNDLLTTPGVPEKRHIELQLPSDMSYEPGDYLAVLPTNSIDVVSRVLARFHLPWDAVMTLKNGSHSSFPAGKELPISNALATYVELHNAATQKNIATIAAYAPDDATKEQIAAHKAGQTPSILDILEEHPKVELPFNVFLAMLTPMRIRQYSISSSPLVDPSKASITFSVAGMNTTHPGVATTYLRSCTTGAKIQVAIKKPSASFRLPSDKKMPMIMMCAGSGLAPFRGFVQDRVARIKAASDASDYGQALLFVGCRDPAEDQLFKEEFAEAEKLGAVKVYHAFSRQSSQSAGTKYVQDRVFHERETVRELFRQGAKVYICGNTAMSNGVTDAVAKMKVEAAEKLGQQETLESAKEWWQGLRNERYAVDVFA